MTRPVDFRLREALARFSDVGSALEATASEANVLAWLAQRAEREARSRKTRTSKRARLMQWLGRVKAGEEVRNFGRFTPDEGRAALAATARGGLAAAAAKLTGISVDRYLDAQRNASRGKPRNMCRARKRA